MKDVSAHMLGSLANEVVQIRELGANEIKPTRSGDLANADILAFDELGQVAR